MKKLINNKKGFTLIELLAVIVILAILVMVSIPAVMRYLDTARKGTFSDAAATAVSAVRNDVIVNGRQGLLTYKVDASTPIQGTNKETPKINDLLEVKLNQSPFGGKYYGYILANVSGENTKYYVCLGDEKHIIKVNSESIDKDKVESDTTGKGCETIPTTIDSKDWE